MKACVRKCTVKKHIKQTIPQVQQDGDHGQNTIGGFGCDISVSPASPTPQTYHETIDELNPGGKYILKVRADSNTGGSIEAKGITRPYTGTLYVWSYIKMCCACIYKNSSSFLFFFAGRPNLCLFCCVPCLYIILLSLIAVFILGVITLFPLFKDTILHNETHCETDYILSFDTIQCGKVNSLKYEITNISGTVKTGDTIQGVLQAWLVKESHLKVYAQKSPTVTDGATISDRTRIYLNGWNIYTWKNSTISGYCCIYNNGTTAQTAYMDIFVKDKDLLNFLSGEGSKNAILSDNITIPPKRQVCFQKWGTSSPLIVNISSYHFIGVDVPANTTFTSSVTVEQVYVNGSDYGTPHYFKCDNFTSFKVPHNRHFWEGTEYVLVCKAPLDESQVKLQGDKDSKENITLASRVGAESLHIQSCNEPHHWTKTPFPVLLAVSFLLIITIIVTSVVSCICQYKCCRHRLIIPCNLCVKNGYDRLSVQSAC